MADADDLGHPSISKQADHDNGAQRNGSMNVVHSRLITGIPELRPRATRIPAASEKAMAKPDITRVRKSPPGPGRRDAKIERRITDSFAA
jgi:hypothetical protein